MVETKNLNENKIIAQELENDLIVSSSPHIFSKDTTSKIMLDVLIALLPATIASVIIFGLSAGSVRWARPSAASLLAGSSPMGAS